MDISSPPKHHPGHSSPSSAHDTVIAKSEGPQDSEALTKQKTPEANDEPAQDAFSIFTNNEKRWISSVASIGAMFSTLSSYIYVPALVPIANDLNVSLTLVNLSVTSYMVIAGIAPAFMGDLADQGGRRPAYILMFTLALVSNIGLAVQNSYPLLLVLRMIQSAGVSGSYGAAYGIIADITKIPERGSFTGNLIFLWVNHVPIQSKSNEFSTNAAPSFGPVIAGVLAERHGWRAIFWFLVAFTGSYLLIVVGFLPETQRKTVGNGSIPTRGIHRSLFDRFTRSRTTKAGQEATSKNHRKCHVPNPFKCIVLLFSKANFTVIMIGSITYAVKMTLQTSLAAQVISVYSLNYLQAGLTYLPSGIGGAMASYATGKFLDKNIKTFFRLRGRGYQRGDDISDIPIEEIRFKGIYTLIFLSAAGTVGYGVGLQERAHIAVPLIMQFISGAATSSIFTLCGTLLTDLNPQSSATVQASYNLVRCIAAAAAIASQEPLNASAGSSWCFGVFAIIMALAAPLAWYIRKRGTDWRTGVA